MARLNISIPDPLHERLERLRDRLNVSKVCQAALEWEIDMLEAKPQLEDPDIQAAIARFQSTADRWRTRGYQDGRTWAVQTATREELIATTRKVFDPSHEPTWPPSFNEPNAIERWIDEDLDVPALRERAAAGPKNSLRFELELSQKRRAAEQAADHSAYAIGWFHAVNEVWSAVSAALHLGLGATSEQPTRRPFGAAVGGERPRYEPR